MTALNNKNTVLDGNDLTQKGFALNTDNSALNTQNPVTDANDLTQSPFKMLLNWGATPKPPPVSWVVQHMFQADAEHYIAGEPGAGKSWVMCDMAVSVASGTPFLGRRTEQGPVLIINFDDSETLPRQYAERTAHDRGYDFADLPLHYWQTAPNEGKPLDGILDANVFAELAFHVRALKPKVIFVDSFSTSFPGLDGNKGQDIVRGYEVLRQLRILSPGSCLIMIDHTPKEVVMQSKRRGVSGSQQKNARVRSGHIISEIAPSEVGGEDMLRWDYHKANAVPPQHRKSFGISRVQTATTARLTVQDLPENERAPKATQAREAALTTIQAAGETGIPRTDLIEQVATIANVGRRTVEAVIDQDVRTHPQVIEKLMPGRGKPKLYKWRSVGDDESGPSGDETTPDAADLTQNPIALNHTREGRENTISRNDAIGYAENTLREKKDRCWPTAAERPFAPNTNRREFLEGTLQWLAGQGKRFPEPLQARAEALRDYLEACTGKECDELILKPDTAPAEAIRIEAMAHYGAARELTATGTADLFAWTQAAEELTEQRRRSN